MGKIEKITDFITQVKLFSEKNGIEIQLFDAHLIFGKDHLLSAYRHAKRSLERGETSTHSLGKEVLLYASGERQIIKAIKKMGIKDGENNVVVVFLYTSDLTDSINDIIDLFLDEFKFKKDDSVLNPEKSLLKKFGIENAAISSVRNDQVFNLVLEKIALVDVIKK